MSVRGAVVHALAPRGAPAKAGHIGLGAGLVEKHQPRGVKSLDADAPLLALGLYVVAVLLAGA